MDKPNRHEAGPSRSTLYRTTLGAIFGSVVGVFFASPIRDYFYHFAPWVGPAVLAGAVGIVIVVMITLPRVFQRRANENA